MAHTKKYDDLRQYSEEELLELLRRESDEDRCTVIEQIVLEKEALIPSGHLEDVATAWDEFVEGYQFTTEEATEVLQDVYPDMDTALKSKPTKRNWRKIFLLAAALTAIAMALTIMTGANRTFMNLIASWTDDSFSYGEHLTEAEQQAICQEDIEKTLLAAGFDPGLAPTWLPKEGKIRSIDTIDLDSATQVQTRLSWGHNAIVLQYYRHNSEAVAEKKRKEYASVGYLPSEIGGVSFLIYQDTDFTTAVWTDDLLEVVIHSTASDEITQKVISSMEGLK